jgi:ribosome maturation factor RimP
MALSLETELEAFLAGIGFELVTVERGGGRRRPLLRLRVDRPDSRPGRSTVTLDDCAAVSREVRKFLEGRGSGEHEWILEVSSPGIDRPLTMPRDYARFAGERIRLRGHGPLAGGSRTLEGRLIGFEPDGPSGDEVVIDVEGERVVVPLSTVSRATLAVEFADEL